MGNSDNKGAGKTGRKGLIQAVTFVLISCIASVIQLVLVNALYFALRGWTAPLPGLLAGIFTEQTMGAGHANWGYVLPFFLSNLIANIVAYIINKNRTFKSDAPKRNFVIYMVILFCLILFSTWLQGAVAGKLLASESPFWQNLAPTVAMACAGTLQMIILFPLEKFVLLKERKDPAQQN